jgi:hypothetical protein
MSDIQHKPVQVSNYKIEENSYTEKNFFSDWPSGSTELFNAKFKAWEIRRGFATEETHGGSFRKTNNSFFKPRKKSQETV